MFKTRWLLALPLVLAASLPAARASAIRDDAGLFSAEAVSQARDKLDRIEREYRIPATIETVETLNGRNIDAVLPERARALGAKGLFVLIAKKETKIEVERSGDYARAFPVARLRQIRAAFITGLKKAPDAGLSAGVDAIEKEAAAAHAETGGAPAGRVIPRRGPVAAPRAGFGLGSLIGIGLIILAVLVGIRLLGALMGGNRGGYAGRPGMGPGYGGPGYGGGGGGFMSSLFGGIGGALAGNWLYDQFSGRHHGDNAAYGAPDQGAASAPESNDWGGGDGGADWGGGGGDAGGGGGDWGGGGGGDWGGGGDGGGGGDW